MPCGISCATLGSRQSCSPGTDSEGVSPSGYHDSLARLEQDVYDRFFTRIEQRVTRKEIQELRDTFSRVEFPGNYPYYHFLCER